MDITISLAIVTIIGTLAGIAGYFLMRQKFIAELENGKIREEQLAQKVYEIAVLKEIGDRIGYSLDGAKIVEIISGSLGKLLPYSAVSHIILGAKDGKVKFLCAVSEVVSPSFVQEVKAKMLAAVSEMNHDAVLDNQVDESVSGAILDDTMNVSVASFFNLPIVISGKLVGLINISSKNANAYSEKNTEVLYRIAKQASEAVSRLLDVLENEKGRLVQAVDSLADGVLMVDTTYQVAIANKKLCGMLGVSQNPEIFDIVNVLSGQLDLRTKMEEAIAKGEAESVQEINVGDKVLQVYASRVMDRQNVRPMGVVVLFHDITDAKSLERLRSDFTSMMVHELRAPLTSIRSSVELIKPEAEKSETLKKYLSIIDSTSGTMLELVGDLLDVAKLESGKFDIVPANDDLAAVISERVASFEPQATVKNLKIALNVDPHLPQAYFDKVRTKQVINNLLSNAIKYSEGGTITVSAKAEAVNEVAVDILVAVSDTGIGIDAEDIGKLFSRFGQLAAGRRAGAAKSSGLGLFVTRGIVEGQGGKIWAESPGAGAGSIFYFTVPAARAATKHGSEEPIVFSTKKVAQA